MHFHNMKNHAICVIFLLCFNILSFVFFARFYLRIFDILTHLVLLRHLFFEFDKAFNLVKQSVDILKLTVY